MERFPAKMRRLLRPGKTALLATLELADVALDGIPIPGAKGAIRAVLDLIRGIDTTSRNSETLAELENHIRFLTELLEPLTKMDRLNLPSGLEDDLGRLSQELESIVSTVKSRFSAGVVRRFLERHENEHHLRTFAQKLREALDRFHRSQTLHRAQDLHLQGQEQRPQRQEPLPGEQSALVMPPHADNAIYNSGRAEVEEGVAILANNISITTGSGGAGVGVVGGIGGMGGSVYFNNYGPGSSALLMSLPQAGYAAHDSGRDDAPVSCLEGTRVAVLAQIMSWLESAHGGSPPVYWISGLAGIGKSTIAYTIAEQAKEKKLLGASFFFSRSDGPLCDPKLVFPTLAFQLAQSDNSFKKVIGDALQQDAALGHKALWSQVERLILTPLGKLGPDRRTTLIVLDALDECEENGGAAILQYLFFLVARIPFLRILITSRPEHHISSIFNTVLSHATTVLHDIEASVVQEDIRYYISTELGKIPQKLDLPLDANWASQDDINSLVERSGKLFVYAATSIRFISDNRVLDPPRQLSLILSTQSAKEAGAKPYTQLDHLYIGVLRNSVSDSTPQDIMERFQVVVGSIVLLREPLPLHSLAQFVRYEVYKIHNALRHLQSVIIPPSNDDEAPRIYHPSFRDFIMDESRCSEAGFLIVPVPEQERRHAIRCFELMGTFLKQDVAGISNLSLLNSEVDGLGQKVKEALSPEVQYACRYWASHLSLVEIGDKTMMKVLEVFSMGSILVWLEAMSLIGSISNSASSIQEAHRWAMSSNCELTVVTILSDAHRFILAHAEVIRASALQVYHSALAFTPHDTTLYKTYSRDASHSIGVLQGVESQWQPNLSTLAGHSDWVMSVAFSPDGLRLASGSIDDTLRLWDAMSGAHIATLKGHSNPVTSVAFSPDGLRLASGSDDYTLRLWDAMSGAHITTLQGHSQQVTSVAFSPDGSQLASGSYDHTLRLWDATSGAHITTLEEHSDWVRSVAFSPDGSRLASGSDDCTLRLWDAMSGAHIATLTGHSGWVTSVAFSPDGLRLASASNDNTLRLWDALSGAYVATLTGHSHWVTSVVFSPDGLRLASGSGDHTLRLWDALSGAHITTLDHSDSVMSVAFSPDGSRLASGSDDHTLRLWGIVSGAHITTLEGHSDRVRSVVFSPDGLRLASGSNDHTLQLWDALSGAHITTLDHSDLVMLVAFSLDGLRLASGSDDHTLRLWDGTSGAHIATLKGHSDPVWLVVFSPDGSRLASGSDDCTLRLWDAMSGVHIATLTGHSGCVRSVAFSPDGLRLASGSHDHTLRLWDVMSGAHIITLEGHSSRVTSVAFSPDGLRLASASDDHTLRLWDAWSGAHVATLTGHPCSDVSVAFFIDSRTLTSHAHTETLTWDLTSEPPCPISRSRTVAFPPTIGLSSLNWSIDGPWMQVQHPQECHPIRICYIPTHYIVRTIVAASSLPTQSQVAVGCGDGRVIILDLQHHPFVHWLRQLPTSY